MKKLRKTQAALDLPTLTLEGGLFLPDQLENAALGRAQWQTEADYGTPKGLKLKDEYTAHRAQLRAELDAYYAKRYGLTRDDLRYILDPADVMGEDYPSVAFRVLKNKELREFGEYRTQRLVMAAWDELGDN